MSASSASIYCIFAALLPDAIHAFGNGSSFIDAASSDVAYSKTPYQPAISCAALAGVDDPEAQFVSANHISSTADQAEYCLVYGEIAPEIEFVVQLPVAWNGRLYVHGNGGDGGESVRGDFGRVVRDRAVRHGFVASFSNIGHKASDFKGSEWAFNSPQREIDYRYRALHLNTVVVKRLIASYYGRKAIHAYFEGCSTGGGQGLRSAQLYPQDFDGIVAGAPVFDTVKLLLYVWNNQKAQQIMQLTPDRLELLGRWLMEKYDAIDGLRDGVISNPAAIDFNPGRDLPRSGEAAFTEAEVDGLALAYGGLEQAGKQIAPGIPIGAELAGLAYLGSSFAEATPVSAWEGRVLNSDGSMPGMQFVLQEWLRYVLFAEDDPERSWQDLDLAVALPQLVEHAKSFGAIEADLTDFREQGGKLLIYNGWGDVGVSPYLVTDYYRQLETTMGEDTDEFARLFLVPGMFHCRGGLGVDRFDAMTAMIEWLEGGKAPNVISAHRVEGGEIKYKRPLCPFPRVATSLVHGQNGDEAEFVCR